MTGSEALWLAGGILLALTAVPVIAMVAEALARWACHDC